MAVIKYYAWNICIGLVTRLIHKFSTLFGNLEGTEVAEMHARILTGEK